MLTIAADNMLFAGMIVSWGTLIAFSLMAAGVLGLITYRAQQRWYGDDRESAMIKALIVGFLTAIPTPIPTFLYLPAGAVGLVHILRKKS